MTVYPALVYSLYMQTTHFITPADIHIGLWFDRDGVTYCAAYVNNCVLTAPEHADLSDEALMAEAIAEARRAEILS